LRIIELFEWLDLSGNPNCYDYYDAIRELKLKAQRIELRNAYSKIISSTTDDARHDARIAYLRQRRQLGDVDTGELPF